MSMRFLVALLIVFPLVAVARITFLTEENFEDEVQQQPSFIMFFADWCPICKRTKPHWSATELAFQGVPGVLVSAIDADKVHSIGQHYNILGYPTFKFFPGGGLEPVEYNGPRNTYAFINFLNAQTGLNQKAYTQGQTEL